MVALMLIPAQAANRFGDTYHAIQIEDETGVKVTDITNLFIYLPDTTTNATIYSDKNRQNTITIPMTEASANTTLVDGQVSWWGPDLYDFSMTNGDAVGPMTNSGHAARASNIGRLVFPSYLQSISSTSYTSAQTITMGDGAAWVINAGGASADRITFTPATTSTSAFYVGNASFTSDFNLFGDGGFHVIWDTSENTLELLDNVVFAVGTGDDYTITHNGSTTTVAGAHTVSGVITQTGDMLFDGTAGDISWDASEDTLCALDDGVVGFGNTAAAPDIEMSFDAVDLDVTAAADGTIWKWGNGTNDFDMWWYGSDVGDYMLWDEGAAELTFVDAHAQFNDDGTVTYGTDGDFSVYSDTANTLEFDPGTAGNTIKFGTADTDAVDMIWYGDVSGDTVTFNEELNQVEFEDSELQMMDDTSFQLGDTAGGDASVEYDTTTHNAVLWAGAGHIGVKKIIEVEAATSETVLATESGKVFINTSGAGTATFTLPAAAAGLTFTFIDISIIAGDHIVLQAGSGDAINSGTVAKAYKNTTTARPQAVTLVAVNATSWEVADQVGTWANDNS